MKNNESDETENNNKKINGWKWAFIAIVLFIIGFIVYFFLLIQPFSSNRPEVNESSVEQEELNLTTSANKMDAEVIINSYLAGTMGEDFESYEIVLTDKLEIHGTISVLTVDVPYILSFAAYAMEDGNLQLRGENVELANISLPVSAVMSLFARQMTIPTFIEINSVNQMITIHLDELMQENAFGLSVKQVDLERDIIEFNLRFKKDLLTDQLD